MLSNRQRLIVKTAVLTLLAAGAGAGAAGLALLYGGWYNIGATAQHFPFVYTVLEEGMKHSVRHHAQDIRVPSSGLGGEQQLRLGARVYRDKCVQCHGAPGVAQSTIGMSMQPIPGPLVDATQRWEPRELYWVTKHGIKMSGMPAWRHRLRDDELWAVVSFVRSLPQLTPAEFRRQTAAAPASCDGLSGEPAREPGDPARGKVALHQHACSACHVIPGVVGSDVHVGPSLEGYGRRELITGRLPATPEALARWIREPHAIDPHSAMPTLPMSEQAARDMAAYLATLR